MNMLHYLPGCDVKKNHPQALLAIQKYMQEKGAIIDQCCRNKDKFLEDHDIICLLYTSPSPRDRG